MSPNLSMIIDGKKFMWDGRPYDTKEDASRMADKLLSDNFDVRIVEEGGKFLIYTRRVVKEVVVRVQ
jgi:hypothetical protein